MEELKSGSPYNRLLAEPVSFVFPGFFMRMYQKSGQGNRFMDFTDKPIISLSFDCDLPKDISALPKILKLLSGYKFKTSFACIGKWVEKHVDLHLRIINEGHEIINHTYSHPNSEIFNPNRRFNLITYQERQEEVIRCHEVINKLLNYTPIGFRVPHFGNQFVDDIYKILSALNYRYSSSTVALKSKSRGYPYRAHGRVIEFPLSPCPSHPLACLDSYHFFRTAHPAYKFSHRHREDFLKCFNKLLKSAGQSGAYLNVYFDPLDIVENNEFGMILNLIANADASVLNYSEIIQRLYAAEKV